MSSTSCLYHIYHNCNIVISAPGMCVFARACVCVCMRVCVLILPATTVLICKCSYKDTVALLALASTVLL